MKENRSFIRGYSLVAHSFISYMFLALIFTCLSNVVFPQFAGVYGWDVNVLATFNTIGAVCGALSCLFLGQWVEHKGPKQVLIFGFLVGGINMILFAFAGSLPRFLIHLIIAHICAMAYCQMTTNNLIARWFVKKKGAMLGITTAGLPAGTALFLPLYAGLSAKFGYRTALSILGIMILVIGLLSIVWVKNTPEEVGLTPDNIPMENRPNMPAFVTHSFGELLKNKTVWLLIIIFGLMFCATIASAGQLVPYFLQHGFDQTQAVGIVGFGALAGIIGSVIFGAIDQKFGVKTATFVYCIIAAVVYGAMFFIPGGKVLIALAIMAFVLNGAPGNLMPSYFITLFGPESFNSVSKIITPIVCLLRALGYMIAAAFALIFAGGLAKGIYCGLLICMVVCTILVCFLKKDRIEL